MVKPLFDKIKKNLSKEIPSEMISKIPDKWEKIGDIGIIKLDPELNRYSKIIGKYYSEILGCKTILNDIGGIKGTYRKPITKVIFGSNKTETIHKENQIRFKLDPKKIMFSSGNMDERLRMATISNIKEVVVDMFAGIGYFTLPMAVYSRPKKIFACEINPISYNYLCENIILNNVTDIVEPLKGDNRLVAPKNVADRVILGYFENTSKFLKTALDCLKGYKGIIHYHVKISDKDLQKKQLKIVKQINEKDNGSANIINKQHIKSYAPGISHYVFDIGID